MNRLAPARGLIGALAAVCVVGSGSAVAQESPTDDEAAVRALIVRFYQAYGKEDLAGIKGLWSARVPGLDRLMAAFEPTLSGKDFSFADVAVSRIDVKSIVASARVTVDATIVYAVSKETAHEGWVRNFMLVKDAEGWRVWRDASAAEDTAIEIRGASTAVQAASIVEREPGLMTGEVSQALFGLGNRFRNSGRVEDAQETYRLSEQVAERSGNPVVVAQSRTNVGVNSQMTGDYDRALESFQQALALLEPTGDKARIAGAESNVGTALYLKKRYPEAIERYQRALAYFESVDHKAAMASALHGIGNAQYLANDFGAALASYQRALAVEESSGDTAAEANTLQAIGMVQKEQGDYDAALESYAGSLARHEKHGNKAGRGVVLASLGDVHRLMGSYARALECYFTALPLLAEIGDKEAVASTQTDVASVYAAERRFPQSLDYFSGLSIRSRRAATSRGSLAWRREWERSTSPRRNTSWRWRSTSGASSSIRRLRTRPASHGRLCTWVWFTRPRAASTTRTRRTRSAGQSSKG
jgi:tetratricopeptide (TPR) repeat protein